MSTYLSPYLYEDEVSGKQMKYVINKSTAVFIGLSQKGPIDKPILITCYEQFNSIFGDTYLFGNDSKQAYLSYAVDSFFNNGGTQCYIIRVAENASLAHLVSNKSNSKRFKYSISTTVNDTELISHELVIQPASPGKWAHDYNILIHRTKLNELNPNEGIPSNLASNFRLSILRKRKKGLEDVVIEEFDNLTLNPLSKDFLITRIKGKSHYITISEKDITKFQTLNKSSRINFIISNDKYETQSFAGGNCGIPKNTESDLFTAENRGIETLDKIDGLHIISIPDAFHFNVKQIHNNAINYVNKASNFSFLILDSAENDDEKTISQKRFGIDGFSYSSNNSALYYPWISVRDRITRGTKNIPPSGAIAGIISRTDKNRGVFKSPAGTVDGFLNSIVDPIFNPLPQSSALLNSIGVNVIRNIPGSGTVVTGAHTISQDTQWKNIAVRRSILFLKKSIMEISQSALFELGAPIHLSSLKRDISRFLRSFWKNGGLVGDTEEKAFIIKIDEDNNSQGSRNVGTLIINVGVALSKSGEFSFITIGQTQNNAQAAQWK